MGRLKQGLKRLKSLRSYNRGGPQRDIPHLPLGFDFVARFQKVVKIENTFPKLKYITFFVPLTMFKVLLNRKFSKNFQDTFIN